MPRVSVIIPTHNRASLVCQAIDSVLAQTYKDFEIIVVDDGSIDNTRDVLSGYSDRITYIYQEQAGAGAARNAGIRASRKCELLAFLDSDDLWSPTKLACQVTLLDKQPDVNVVYVSVLRIDPEGTQVWDEYQATRQGEIFMDLLLWGGFSHHFMCVQLSAVMMRSQVIDKVGLFDDTLPTFEDVDFMIRVAKAGNRFGCIQSPLCSWRVTPNSLGSDMAKNEAASFVILRKIFDDPNLPRHIAALHNVVYAMRYIQLGTIYFNSMPTVESLQRALSYLAQAATLVPTIPKYYLAKIMHIYSNAIKLRIKRLLGKTRRPLMSVNR